MRTRVERARSFLRSVFGYETTAPHPYRGEGALFEVCPRVELERAGRSAAAALATLGDALFFPAILETRDAPGAAAHVVERIEAHPAPHVRRVLDREPDNCPLGLWRVEDRLRELVGTIVALRGTGAAVAHVRIGVCPPAPTSLPGAGIPAPR